MVMNWGVAQTLERQLPWEWKMLKFIVKPIAIKSLEVLKFVKKKHEV